MQGDSGLNWSKAESQEHRPFAIPRGVDWELASCTWQDASGGGAAGAFRGHTVLHWRAEPCIGHCPSPAAATTACHGSRQLDTSMASSRNRHSRTDQALLLDDTTVASHRPARHQPVQTPGGLAEVDARF